MGRARAASAACAVAVAAGLLAGCGGSGGTKAAPPWSSDAPQSDGLVKGSLPTGSPDRKAVGGTPWSFTLAGKGDPNVPTTQWPAADTVLTADQLKAAIPEASSVTLGDCAKGASGPAKTTKNASCTWQVSLKDSGGYTSSVTVSVVAIGADQTDSGVTSSWTSTRDKNFSGRKATERYFTQGSFGAKGSYYLDNDQSSVLVSDGNIAAWIDLTFQGFNSLKDTRQTLMTGIFPVLAKDLADRLPRKYV